MNPDDEKLRRQFREIAPPVNGVPSFEEMWDRAARPSKKQPGGYAWRIAAGIALIATVAALYLRKPSVEPSGIEIAAWEEVTDSLLPSEIETGSGTISDWSSPTAFLLIETNNNIQL